MNDVTGMPQTAVVVGGGSDLARAVLRRLAVRRLESCVLAGRDRRGLEVAAEELRSLGVGRVEIAEVDVRDVARHRSFVEESIASLGSVDLVLVAAGLLGSADLDELDTESVAASVETNFSGPAALLTAFAQVLRSQGHGRLVVFSSVAGIRVRAANFVYGAGKAGLDGFCQGLADVLAGSGVDLVIVRPGFVRTKMTAGRPAAPFAVGAEDVADAVVRGLERGAPVVWVPEILRPVFAVLRVLPRAVWRRLPG